MVITQEKIMPIEVEETERELTPEAEDDLQSGYVPEQDYSPLRLQPFERRVITQPYDFLVEGIISQMDHGTLTVDPPYQRGYVWDNTRASRLIESLLLNIPIPPCYFAEEEPGMYTVIDGHQRLRSISRFVKGHYELKGLVALDEFNAKKFSELTEREKRTILGRTIRCIIITQESHPEIRFEVFERLNTGSMKLTDQEIRNAIYRGDFNDLIKSLAEQSRWIQVLNKSRLDKRMRDDELVLRFFALHDKYLEYQSPLRSFLNKYMESQIYAPTKPRRRVQLSQAETQRLTQLFEQTVDKVLRVFGDHAFRIYDEGWERQVNRAVFDAVMLVFSKLSSEDLAANRQGIETALINLCRTKEFFTAISRATADAGSLYRRIGLFSLALAEIGLDSGIHESIDIVAA